MRVLLRQFKKAVVGFIGLRCGWFGGRARTAFALSGLLDRHMLNVGSSRAWAPSILRQQNGRRLECAKLIICALVQRVASGGILTATLESILAPDSRTDIYGAE